MLQLKLVNIIDMKEWEGQTVECLLHIKEGDSSESFLIRKITTTKPGSGAAPLANFPQREIIYQSPNYSEKAHDNMEYWWLSRRSVAFVEAPKTNREAATKLTKTP